MSFSWKSVLATIIVVTFIALISALFLFSSPFTIPSVTATSQSPEIIRGPYLQAGSTDQMIIRWRTNNSRVSTIRYGTNQYNLDQTATSPAPTTEHLIHLTGLNPDTRYYYTIMDGDTALTDGDAYFFETHLPTGSTQPFRIWAIGDSGTANSKAAAVRDAFLTANGGDHTDMWLMLGDNAYADGTDEQYQAAVFDMYPTILRNTILWPTIGNHDHHVLNTANETGPYYEMFSLPKAGEAGGVPSGTESYYSFDYGNVHVVVLDSIGTDTSADSEMATWLRADLNGTNQEWVIAMWHHPPYSKGSHDSDSEGRLIQMREHFLPILEGHGVDLVLSGHSHSYERSYLLDGHYGFSETLADSMIKDRGDGSPAGDGAYQKAHAPHAGAVYIVAGSSGKTTNAPLDHPAMHEGLVVLGSVIIDVNGKQMDVRFIDDQGAIRDIFRIDHLQNMTNSPTPQPNNPVDPSDPSCVIPPSGPWPPCATGGDGGRHECAIPPSGPWPPCAAGGNAPPDVDGRCVIPPSGAWPPCATGGNAPPDVNGGCVIPSSGPWPPCATGGGYIYAITVPE